MSGAAPYDFKLEPTTIQGIRTKMMIPDSDTANIARLIFEMYAEPSTSFGDIARYFAQEGTLVYEKELSRGFISQMLRNPIYAQADLELYEFFKGQGAVVVNEAADFAGTNGCYLYQGRDVQERKNKDLKFLRACLKSPPRMSWRRIFRPDCVKNPCHPSGCLRIFALQGKKSSRQSIHVEILNRR